MSRANRTESRGAYPANRNPRDGKRFDPQGLNIRKQKRRTIMTYNKPEVLKLDGALSAIQGSGKIPPSSTDNNDAYPPDSATPSAYESDE